MIVPAFSGPAYTSQNPTAACDRLVNWYPESLENAGEQKARAVLYPTPGRKIFCNLRNVLGDTPLSIVGLFGQNGRCFALVSIPVLGRTALFEISVAGIATAQTMTDAPPPLSAPTLMASNGVAGHQLAFTGGLNTPFANGYIYDFNTGAVTRIADADFPDDAACMQFVDGYFAILRNRSTTWQISDLEDGESWSGLMVAQRSFATDNLVALGVSHREVWLLGEQTSEVWYDSGATFPFQPISGVFLEVGCAARNSVVNLDNTLYWLARDTNGSCMVVRAASGYTPQRISTHAIEFAISQYTTVEDAVAYAYQDQGHTFYVLTFPTGDQTWVYDAATGLWHERGDWSAAEDRFHAIDPWVHCYAFGKHLVGSRTSGIIYEESIAIPDNVSQPIRRVRTGIHLSNELKYTFYHRAQVDLEVGAANAVGSVTPTLPTGPFFVPRPPPTISLPVSAAPYAWIAPFSGRAFVEAIGGGGGTRGAAGISSGGGGGGGAYAATEFDFVAGQSYLVQVGTGGVSQAGQLTGTNGAHSWMVDGGLGAPFIVFAGGGQGGAGSAGGGGAAVTGQVLHAGGNGGVGGGDATVYGSGGGGSGARTAVGHVGTSGTTVVVGVGGLNGDGLIFGRGGDGGWGTAPPAGAPMTVPHGQPGFYPGGGGGGGQRTAPEPIGGNGADGALFITYLTITGPQRIPELSLRWSDDGGQTWSQPKTVGVGALGDYGTRALWRRLGRGRDRVFELSVSDPIPWRLTNLLLDVGPGVN